ncbi:MAG TPA: hypothetical protein VLL97_06300 [Acidobacteriota bacterium]|nr:hypothetical protein [Acidobacteriota bacterium]
MKIILIIAGIVVLALLLVVGGLIYFFQSGELLKMGAEQSLLLARSQVAEALPPDYPPEKILALFDTVLERAKSGHINTAELKNLLVALPAKLLDGRLDPNEADSVIQHLHKITAAPQEGI